VAAAAVHRAQVITDVIVIDPRRRRRRRHHAHVHEVAGEAQVEALGVEPGKHL